MVLSTSELKPTASIAGIQYHPQSRCRIPQPITKTVDSLNKNKDSLHSQSLHSASAFNPLNPNQLLLAVSASQSTYSDSIPTNRLTYLQTFDLATTHHISRQALTRTNTTTVNIGPDGGKIGEPNVRHLRVSHDGQWLATVDEWCPPAKDIDFLSVSEDFKEEEQRKRLEVYLKFWSWNSETKEWQLVSRVDWPHDSTSADSSGAGKVLSLVADPSAVAFASYGEDGVVRFWRPRLRRRNGIEVLGKNAEGLISWYCRHMVQLRNPARERTLADVSPRASMAFSEDGSLLTVSEQGSTTDKTGVVHFIDALSGQIRQFREGLYDGNLVDMGIVDRYLIILSEQLIVWDMVHDQLHFGLSLESYRLSSQDWVAASHLAVDRIRQTFAIALPIKGSKGHKSATQSEDKFQSEMTIFDPSQPNPLYTTSLPHTVTSILSTEGSKGYIVLDSAAEVRIISPKSMPFLSDLVVADSYTQSPRGLENVYGHNKMDGITLKIDDNNVSEAESNVVTPRYTSSEPRPDVYDDDDVPVVSQQQLASIFDVGPAFAMPPVEELFEQVAGLFAKKPRTLS